MIRRRRALVGLVLAALVGAVFGARQLTRADHAGASPRPAVVHYAVGTASCTFTDATRSTHNFYTGKTTPGRVLDTDLYYPTLSGAPGASETPGAPPARRHGPYPLVVFAEGYAVSPGTYATLLNYWVRSGFVVAAPRFPDTDAAALTAQHGVDTEEDDINQPADVGFVIHQIALAETDPHGLCPLLDGLLQPGQVALAGQSDGAETVAGLAYDRRYLEAGLVLRAVAVLSGQAYDAGTAAGPDHYLSGPPLLVTQSATDACNPPQLSTQLYNLIAQPDRWFLTIRSAYHLPPYSGTDAGAFAVVAAVTTRLFSLEFAHEQPGRGFLAFGDRSPSVASLTTGATAPALAPLAQSAAACYEGI